LTFGCFTVREQDKDAFSENESLAIDELLRFAHAEAFFTSRYRRSATLAELMATEYLAIRAIDGLGKHGYRFSQVSVGPSQMTWEFKAEPLIADRWYIRSTL